MHIYYANRPDFLFLSQFLLPEKHHPMTAHGEIAYTKNYPSTASYVSGISPGSVSPGSVSPGSVSPGSVSPGSVLGKSSHGNISSL
jgi:hypothetical protein